MFQCVFLLKISKLLLFQYFYHSAYIIHHISYTIDYIMNVFVLLPIDLYYDISYLKDSKVFLVEETHYFDRSSPDQGSFKFNILKPIYHRATMKSYYDFLISKKINCEYVDLEKDWIKIVKAYLSKYGRKNKNVKTKVDDSIKLNFYDPVDRCVEKKIKDNFDEYDMINSPRFVLTTEEMTEYDGALRQTSFYAWIRNLKQILMTNDLDSKNSKNSKKSEQSKPLGGKLTYDKDNRKKPYDGIEDDVEEPNYTKNDYVEDAFKYVKKTFNNIDSRFVIWDKNIKNIKKLSDSKIELKFPIDRKGSLSRLRFFIKYNLFRFGDYQDVILSDRDNSFVFHSGLSPMMNIGLITPEEIIDEIIKKFNTLNSKQKSQRINDVEGFIRQILGWREFTRYMYQHNEKTKKYLKQNYFNASKTLSKDWYTGTTGNLPIDTCISKAFRFGYLHHIERLMVISNFMVLNEISPKKMYKWFMDFSLDSYDWVMEFNIYCMASYSDGGHFTSKPYISSSKYILNMSNFDKTKNMKDTKNTDTDTNTDNSNDDGNDGDDNNDDWANEWDKLFWNFMKKHKNKIKKIGRLSMLLKYIPQKNNDKKT
jgi:deoxyribodipyrimidine photolyase-related protein